MSSPKLSASVATSYYGINVGRYFLFQTIKKQSILNVRRFKFPPALKYYFRVPNSAPGAAGTSLPLPNHQQTTPSHPQPQQRREMSRYPRSINKSAVLFRDWQLVGVMATENYPPTSPLLLVSQTPPFVITVG